MKKKLTYMEKLDDWLTERIDEFCDAMSEEMEFPNPDSGPYARLKTALTAKIVQSYRNGQRSKTRHKTAS